MADPVRGPNAAEQAGARAARNTIVRAAGEIVGKLASLVLFAALARAVGEAGLGAFVLAFAVVQIAMLPIGLGADRYLLRRVAQDRSRIDELGGVVVQKLALAAPVVAATFVAVNLLDYDSETRAAVYLLAPGVLLDSLAKSLFSVFNAYERGELLAATVVVQRVAAAALGLAALAAGYGVVAVAGTYTAGAALGFGLAVWLLRRSIGLPRRIIPWREWRRLSRGAAPFGVQDLFGILLAKIDAVILSLMATQAAVGRYGAAYRLLEATWFIGSSINGAFAAMYTYLGTDTEPTVQAAFQRSIKLALAALVPCAVTFGVLAEPVSRLIFGAEFEDAAGPLRLLAPAVVLVGVVLLGTSLIVSRRDPRIMVAVAAGMLAVNVALNVVLIPVYGDDGAAAAMLVTEALAVLAVVGVAARTVGGLRWLSMLVSPLVAGAAMAGTMLALDGTLAGALAGGGAVYVGAFLLIERLLSPADLRFVANLLRRGLPSRPAADQLPDRRGG